MLSQCDADLSGSRVITRLTAQRTGIWLFLEVFLLPMSGRGREEGEEGQAETFAGKRRRNRHGTGTVPGQFNVYQEPIIACLAPPSLLLSPLPGHAAINHMLHSAT